MTSILKNVIRKPVFAALLGLILFILISELRIYIAVITVIVFIAKTGKNGVVIYLGYSSFGAFLSFILSILNVQSNIYQQVYVASNYLTFASIGNIIDLIFYIESSGWNGLENFLAFVIFGGLAFLINKFM